MPETCILNRSVGGTFMYKKVDNPFVSVKDRKIPNLILSSPPMGIGLKMSFRKPCGKVFNKTVAPQNSTSNESF